MSAPGQQFAGALAELQQGGTATVDSFTKTWADVLDIAVIKGSSLRLPYCDKVSAGRVKEKVGAPTKAVGVAAFKFSGNNKRPTVEMEWTAEGEGAKNISAWVMAGSIRLPQEGLDMTRYVQPSLKNPPIKSKGKLRRAEGPSMKATRQVGSYSADQDFPRRFEFSGSPQELGEKLRSAAEVDSADLTEAEPGVFEWKCKDVRGVVQYTVSTGKIAVQGPARVLSKYLESFAVALADVALPAGHQWRASTATQVYTEASLTSDRVRDIAVGEVVVQAAKATVSGTDHTAFFKIHPDGFVHLGDMARGSNFTSANPGDKVTHICTYTFDTPGEGELGCEVGDMIHITTLEEGWSNGKVFQDDGSALTGWVPTEYLVPVK